MIAAGAKRPRLRGFDRMNFERDLQPMTHGPENRGEVVHARIPSGREHSMQAFARRFGHLGELLESDGGVDQVTENEAGRFRFTAQKQRRRFVEKCLGKLRIARDALDDGLLEVASKCHMGNAADANCSASAEGPIGVEQKAMQLPLPPIRSSRRDQELAAPPA